MNNKEYFIAALKGFSAQLFFGCVYIIGEPYIKFQFWVEIYPLIKLFVFMFFVLIIPAPFTKDFRSEMSRRRNLKS
jgi:hypothetical protein